MTYKPEIKVGPDGNGSYRYMVDGTISADRFANAASARYAAEHDERCNCEEKSHFNDDMYGDGDGHDYLSVPAGSQRADYVGPICDKCAETHMADWLSPAAESPVYNDVPETQGTARNKGTFNGETALDAETAAKLAAFRKSA